MNSVAGFHVNTGIPNTYGVLGNGESSTVGGPTPPAVEVGDDILVQPAGSFQPVAEMPAPSHVVRPACRKRLGKGVRVRVTRGSVDSATEDPGIKARIASMSRSAKLYGKIEGGSSKSGSCSHLCLPHRPPSCGGNLT